MVTMTAAMPSFKNVSPLYERPHSKIGKYLESFINGFQSAEYQIIQRSFYELSRASEICFQFGKMLKRVSLTLL